MSSSALEDPAIRERATYIALADYERMLAAGIIPEATELIDGTVVDKVTKSPDHNYFADALYEALRRILPPGTIIRSEKTLTHGNSGVEPDIMVVEGPLSRYRSANPATALLVVEVAKTSLNFDRAKARIYALAGVPIYWIVDLDNERVEVHENPKGDRYSEKRTVPFGQPLGMFGKSVDFNAL